MSWLLALHSSSPVLGVGLRSLEDDIPDQVRQFPLGRDLSGALLESVESLLPAQSWPALARLAVATGPGGFTGTRLTVVLARTLAQQLEIPLDGVGSFLLVARRLHLAGPTWLSQALPRRGVVAGVYGPCPEALGGMAQRRQPRLYEDSEALRAAEPDLPVLAAEVDVERDVVQLLELSAEAHAAAVPAPWQPVLPLYPTAPVPL
ncbi:tRNA (adenosine(37)-N6)-threonylcarbamoyltransferase complex dimerization subunit type 1 TsaB [Cyanobium sp. NS01]|uniref:tRNA (adenosine(37)-N6)-threonylcarbamoyltransferase complex dimerization subunit type 1 TsaB n=1 Tax=Cyanobium sp. NS01 TaxID=261284 RepID=UPI001644499D|nr:tRNA (adenosine(37)-N6)-threonylcarbamoyltransferase complex dimerization subunit type 1 TsaB [Cyanobium sp. NS01]QNI69557.1 tRNA threonylcarbamoyladenosine biosynthesis protein TsaB [Cyanobium sp. NS01]